MTGPEGLAALIPMPVDVDWANVRPDTDVACGTVETWDGATVTVEMTVDASEWGRAMDKATGAVRALLEAWRRTAYNPERWTAARELAGG